MLTTSEVGATGTEKGSCVKALTLTTIDVNIAVGFVEDYPNHPRQMCVGSIEYRQRGFQSDPRAFATAIPLAFPTLGTPVPQSTPDNNLTTAISNTYFYDAPVCHRENNCFTVADQCEIAPECAEVTADNNSTEDATAYVKVIARPYVNQQTAYHNVGIEKARERTIPGFPEKPIKAANVGPCKTSAFLVPPQVTYALEDGFKEGIPAKIAAPPPTVDRNFPVLRQKGAFCSERVCLLEYQHADAADKTVEINAFYRASGEWKPIWNLCGPTALEFGDFKKLITHQTGNEGWFEAAELPNLPRDKGYPKVSCAKRPATEEAAALVPTIISP